MSADQQLLLTATPAQRERRADDAYYTNPALASAITTTLAGLIPAPSVVIEPSCGGGAFLSAARATWPDCPALLGYDVRQEAVDALKVRGGVGADHVGRLDWLDPTWAGPGIDHADLILGNPPYLDAQQHIETSLTRLAEGGHLAFLLRLSLLGGAERARTLWARPGLRYLQTVSPRPSFTGTGNDTADVAVFVWQRGFTGRAEILPPLVWRRG